MTNRRLIPLPFPECRDCGRSWGQCLHYGCTGTIDVEPISGNVVCKKCAENWQIWESRFICVCGEKFEAWEIEDALAEVLDHCRQLIYELSAMEDSRQRREQLSRSSMREFLYGMANQLGKIAGIAVEVALKFLFPH